MMPDAPVETHCRPCLPGETDGGCASRAPGPRDAAAPHTNERCNDALGDLRFRTLIPPHEWASLPQSIRRRFSKRLAGGCTFVGEVTETRMSVAGRLLAQAARLIGSPFPTSTDSGVPSGRIWTKLHARRAAFPQVIHSSKRFCGPTGLEEHVGGGVGMTLTVHARAGALVFRSAGYFVDLLGRRLRLPGALTPGSLSVTHAECGDGRFSFTP